MPTGKTEKKDAPQTDALEARLDKLEARVDEIDARDERHSSNWKRAAVKFFRKDSNGEVL